MNFGIQFLAFFAIIEMVLSINIQESFEKRCRTKPTIQAPFDHTWLRSVQSWFIPTQSSLNFLRYSELLLGDTVANLTARKVHPFASCMYLKWDSEESESPKLFGYVQRNASLHAITHNARESGSYSFHTAFPGNDGTSFISLTDNDTFVLHTTCWEDGEESWALLYRTGNYSMVNRPTLSKVMEAVQRMGFSQDFVVEQNYLGFTCYLTRLYNGWRF